MKSKTICILGNYSGRNAGDNAMLEGIMLDLRERFGNVRFTIPTLNPRFIKSTYAGLNAEPVNAAPWRGCLKLLGWPVWKAIRNADLVLVTDAILFDKNLYNPMKNYLSTLSLLLPPAHRRGVPVVLYNVSIGPVATRAGRVCLQRILEAAQTVILRDEISRRTLAQLELSYNHIYTGGDSALGATPASESAIQEAIASHGARVGSRPIVGFNMNAYGASFLRREHSHLHPKNMIPMLARTIRWIQNDLGADVWLFCTQYMDEPLCRRLREEAGAADVPLFTVKELGHRRVLGLMSKLSMMVGMRTHSLILASSWGIPIVGMITYPKTFGYLERVNQGHRSLPITKLNDTTLRRLIGETWADREAVAEEVASAVDGQRRLSKMAADYLAPFLETPVEAPVKIKLALAQ